LLTIPKIIKTYRFARIIGCTHFVKSSRLCERFTKWNTFLTDSKPK